MLRRMLNVAVRKKLLVANPCSGVEFPVRVEGLFRPHYMTWSEQEKIEGAAPDYLRNVIRIITETGLRVYKELAPMKKEDVDLANAVVWIPDSKTASGVAEVPLTELAVEAFQKADLDLGSGPVRVSQPGQPVRATRPASRRSGQRRCGRRAFLTSGFMISDRRMRPGLAPVAWPTNGSRSCCARATRRCSRSIRR